MSSFVNSITTQRPAPQTTGFVCPICQEPLALEISQRAWEVWGSNNAFGHLWNTNLPRGLVFGRYVPGPDGPVLIEPIPKYLHVDSVMGVYTPMHSRCFKAKRAEWVRIQQAACDHAARGGRYWMTRCPECRATL